MTRSRWNAEFHHISNLHTNKSKYLTINVNKYAIKCQFSPNCLAKFSGFPVSPSCFQVCVNCVAGQLASMQTRPNSNSFEMMQTRPAQIDQVYNRARGVCDSVSGRKCAIRWWKNRWKIGENCFYPPLSLSRSSCSLNRALAVLRKETKPVSIENFKISKCSNIADWERKKSIKNEAVDAATGRCWATVSVWDVDTN